MILETYWYLKMVLKITSKIVIPIIFLLATLVGASATTVDSFSVNTSQIPYQINFSHNVTLSNNHTLFINRIDTESTLKVDFPEQTFYGNVSSKLITFNVSIDNDNILNDTFLRAIFVFSSDLNNVTNIYQIESNVTYDTQTVEPIPYQFIQLKDGHFTQNVTTDFLPWKGNFTKLVGGVYNTSANIVCGKWLECPNNIIFERDNQTRFQINYSIPQDAKVGTHVQDINITTDNESNKFTATFHIKLPEISFKPFIYTESCFTTDGNGNQAPTMSCLQDVSNYYYRQNIEMFDYVYSNLNETCENLVETEYVVAGSVDEITWASLKSCEKQKEKGENLYADLQVDYDKSRDQATSAIDRLNECREDLNHTEGYYEQKFYNYMQNESACLTNVWMDSINRKLEADKLVKEGRKQVLWGLFWFCIVVGVFILIRGYAKSSKKWSWT